MTDLEKKTEHLKQLVRIYSSDIIISSISGGDISRCAVRAFVKRNLAKACIPFPFDETQNVQGVVKNLSIDFEQLTIFVLKALSEYKTAYLKQLPKDTKETNLQVALKENIQQSIDDTNFFLERFFDLDSIKDIEPLLPEPKEIVIPRSAPKEVRKVMSTLRKHGHRVIQTDADFANVLADYAYEHKFLSEIDKQAIKGIVKEDRLRGTIEKRLRYYNAFLTKLTNNVPPVPTIPIKEHNKKVQELSSEIRKAKNKALIEVRTKDRPIINLRDRLFSDLRSSKSLLLSKYNLLIEEDIDDYISWYQIIKRPIDTWVVKKIQSMYTEELTLFKTKVSQYNNSLKVNE